MTQSHEIENTEELEQGLFNFMQPAKPQSNGSSSHNSPLVPPSPESEDPVPLFCLCLY